jgi:hypothetical protein
VGRDALLGETGLLASRGRDVLPEQIGKAPSAQRLSPGVDEHLGQGGLVANGEPCAQCCGRGLPQRQSSFPPPLAENADAHRRQVDVLDLQAGQLGYAQPRTDGRMHHGAVTDSRLIAADETSVTFKVKDYRVEGRAATPP